jgi:hypothetical protein
MGPDSLSVDLEQTKGLMNMHWITVFIYGLVSDVSCIVELRVMG